MTGLGWFADTRDDLSRRLPFTSSNEPDDNPWLWQPCLQLEGLCFSFDVWFVSEQECEQFIRDEILPAGNTMLEES